MCIAILNTKQTTLKKQLLKNCWENNGDGAGMLYIDNDNQLKVFKEMKNFNTFYNKYIDVRQKYGKRNIVLHFRISTHGKINETNCHPFLVDDDLGFVHNGMIYNAPTSKDYSDTYMFNETMLKKFKPGFEHDEIVLDLLADYIGMGSKLVFLNSNDEWAIVNEEAGHWNLGCWFSNSSYKQVNNWVDFGGIKKSKSSYKSPTPTFDRTFHWTSNENYISAHQSHYCMNCDMMLSGVKELEDGMCAWCHEEELVNNLEDMTLDCELCDGTNGKYNHYYNAYTCEKCDEYLGA